MSQKTLLITSVGTRGDVQPYVALGLGLQRAGYRVRFLTAPAFASLVERWGLEFRPLHVNPREVFEEAIRRTSGRSWRLMQWLARQFPPVARRYFEDALAAAQGVDAILFAVLGFPAAHVAEALGIPYIGVYLQPLTPTRAFPSPMAPAPPPWLPFKGLTNWLSYRLPNWLLVASMRSAINRCRREILGLPPKSWRFYFSIDAAAIPILYGFSEHVVPRPSDWGPWIHITGYWFLDEFNWRPPRALLEFLDAGSPPVYVGFGSMVDVDRETLARTVVAALQETGQRGILLRGWAGISGVDLPSTILPVDDVPHAWLFPRCSAVIHHGGAGTTAAGFRAGVPQVVVPFYFDQPFWAQRVYALGVGPAPVPRAALTVRRLAEAVDAAVRHPHMQARARALADLIRQEDGVEKAVSLLTTFLDAS